MESMKKPVHDIFINTTIVKTRRKRRCPYVDMWTSTCKLHVDMYIVGLHIDVDMYMYNVDMHAKQHTYI